MTVAMDMVIVAQVMVTIVIMAQLGNGNSYSDGGSDDSCPGNKLMIVLVTIILLLL